MGKHGPKPQDPSAVWNRVDRSGDCWLWTGSTVRGYGVLRIGGRLVYAHRLTFELDHGRPPVGVVMHLCDRPLCVRPDHLTDGSQADNLADAARKGRMSSGEARANHKVTEQDVIEMRRLHVEGFTSIDLAKRYPISARTIRKILSGKNWRHV